MIVLDATVLIAFLDGNDVHHERAVQLLEREIDEELATSVLTLAEVLVGPARDGRLDDAVSAVSDLEVGERAFPPKTAVRLAGLRAATGLRMPDCCVLSAAQDASARVASFDGALVKATNRLGLATRRSVASRPGRRLGSRTGRRRRAKSSSLWARFFGSSSAETFGE